MAGRLRLSQRLAALPAPAPWAGLCGAAVLGALLAQAVDPSLINWQPPLAAAEPWRAVTAAWVHLSPLHLAGNLAATAVVAVLGRVAGCRRRAAVAWTLAWPLTQLGLLAQPALTAYGGLSGVLHAAVAVAAWQLIRGDHGMRRAVGTVTAAGLLAKLWLEAPWQGPLQQVAGWDFPVAPAAHASGALAGWLCALACGVGSTADRPPAAGL